MRATLAIYQIQALNRPKVIITIHASTLSNRRQSRTWSINYEKTRPENTKILTLFYIDYRKTIFWNVLNWLILYDFVPFNIRKVLGRLFLGFLFDKIQEILRGQFFPHRIQKGDPSMLVKMHLFLGPFWVKNGNNSTPNE